MAILNQANFTKYCKINNISESTKENLEKIRKSNPVRRVGSRANNVSGRYASRKMGCTIQFESHTVELSCIYMFEHDPDILEFYDQAIKLELKYNSVNGKTLFHSYTPDFLIMPYNGIPELIECKTEQELIKLSNNNPNKYYKNSNGKWVCPPAEAAAANLGFDFRVISDIELDKVYIRNIRYLEGYLNYDINISQEIIDEISQYIHNNPGTTLHDLLQVSENFTADNINNLLVLGEIYIDLSISPLAEHDRVRVFPNKEIADAYFSINFYKTGTLSKLKPIELQIGDLINWDRKSFRIKMIGEQQVILQSTDNEDIFEFNISQLREMIIVNKISVISHIEPSEIKQDKLNIIQKASEKELFEANRRYRILKACEAGEDCGKYKIADRTLRDWKFKYREAEEMYGDGYIGLISKISNQGNHTTKLDSEVKELMQEIIANQYENFKQISKQAAYGKLLIELEKNGLSIVSQKTFNAAIKNRNTHTQTAKRKGKRTSYQFEHPLYLEQNTPRHGDRVFEIVHIDHTELDIELLYGKNNKTARPWLTIMIDAYSRVILGYYLSFDPPSYRSCMMVIRSCVQRYGRLPQFLVVDGGREFASTYFEQLMARYDISKKERPAAKPRFGSVCERIFGVTNTQLVHTLTGNTQITKNVRQVTKSNNPKNLAIWTYMDFMSVLEKYLFNIYENKIHGTLKQTPREAYELSIAQSGKREHTIIPYNDNFKITTLPTTPRRKATVEYGKGVKINNIYYWTEEFRSSGIIGAKVPVRYDPFNIGIAYAYINSQWHLCKSEFYEKFIGMTEKELRIRSEIIRKEKRLSSSQARITAMELAHMHYDNDELEEKLKKQQEKDSASNHLIIVPNQPTPQATDSKNKTSSPGQIIDLPKIEPYKDRY